MRRDSKWAKQIIEMQDDDRMWGSFHSLASTNVCPMTTEQALRRLQILGFTTEDACIQKAIAYLDDCLTGRKQIPDPTEKLHDWPLFTRMMFAAWIRRFTRDNERANEMARTWARVVTASFESGEYSHGAYINAYESAFSMKPRGGRLVDFVQFYVLSLLVGELDERTQRAMVKYVLRKPDGIYYVYDRCIGTLPERFEGRLTSRYLGAAEMLAEFEGAREELRFIVDWLMEQRNESGHWDMGSGAKDSVYFPLSDDWRRKETREADCTERIEKLLTKLNGQENGGV